MASYDYMFGYLPDKHDPNDRALFSETEIQTLKSGSAGSAGTASATVVSSEPIAQSKSTILQDLPPVYAQGKIGSCTANAACAALRYAYRKYSGKQYKDFEPSRLFAYYYGRVTLPPEYLNDNDFGRDDEGNNIDERVKYDTGSNMRRIIHTFLMHGVCREELWPYGTPTRKPNGVGLFDTSTIPNPTEPDPKLWGKIAWQAKTSSHPKDPKELSGDPDIVPRAISYYRIYDPTLVKNDPDNQFPSNWEMIYNQPSVAMLQKALTDGFPFVFGVKQYTGYKLNEEGAINEEGVCKMPPTGKIGGGEGHALMAVGFHKEKKRFLIQNSWGTEWPKNCKDERMRGRFWMPEAWFTAVVSGKPITYDFWVIKFSGPGR